MYGQVSAFLVVSFSWFIPTSSHPSLNILSLHSEALPFFRFCLEKSFKQLMEVSDGQSLLSNTRARFPCPLTI